MSNWFSKLLPGRTPPAAATVASDIAVDDVEDCKNRGNAYLATGELDAAFDCYQQAISINPDYAEAINNMGFVCLRQGRYDDAERYLTRAVSLNPSLANAHYNLGLTLQLRKRHTEAATYFKKAIGLNPVFAEAHYELGNSLLHQSQPDAAALCYRQAIVLRPDHHQAWNNLGLVLLRQEQLDEAMSCFHEAIRVEPDSIAVHKNMADLLFRQGRLDDAITCIDKAISLDPQLADAHVTKGVALKGQGRLAEAEDCFTHALRLDPASAAARVAIGEIRLCRGELADGWELFGHRFFPGSPARKRDFLQPQWAGEDLRDKTLLIWGDQGIGDELLFASMFSEIIARARRCVIECAPKLVPLFVRSFPAAMVVPRTRQPHPATQAGIDFQIAATDAARWLRSSLESFPRHNGYLTADPARVAYWKARLAELGPGLKVGFCWRSSLIDSFRSLHYSSLDQWGPIFAVPGMHFVNLQYDECAAELEVARHRFGIRLHAFDEVDLFDDLSEAAALTKAMDVVVTAPTAASGLAAAQGVPTLEMSYGTTWVSLGTDHVPWLPSQRLFMRRWDQSWEEVIAAVAEQLRADPQLHC